MTISGGGGLEDKRRTAREAIAMLRPDDTVAVPIATGQPAAFLAALGQRDDWTALTVFGGLLTEPYDFFSRPGVRFISGFYGPLERMAKAAGAKVDYLPADFVGWDRYARAVRPRVVATAVSPLDDKGYFSFGLHSGAIFDAFHAAARDPDRLAIVEVMADMPYIFGFEEHGANRVHVSEVDAVIESDRTPYVLPPAPISPEDRRIAAHVETLIGEGATLQFGIGGIPNSVAQLLAAGKKGDFGIHTEMFVDGIMHLHEAGKIGNHKGIYDGFSIATFAAGSAALYRWLDRNDQVRMLPVVQVNDPAIIRRNRAMVSINGAVAVDLTGQISADTIGPKQYSGVGGHELFVMGAQDSAGGKSLICLRSTVTVGAKRMSSIVATLPVGTPVTTPRHHVQYVVTEHGIAELGLLTATERRDALIAIADPPFRDDLRAAALV